MDKEQKRHQIDISKKFDLLFSALKAQIGGGQASKISCDSEGNHSNTPASREDKGESLAS